VRGSEQILEEIKRVLGIEVGETTPDGKFSLDCLRCVGACGLAPVMMIGEKVYGRMEPKNIRKILEEVED
jgi:NADH-quinone oxidoreductase subunit E/NADP-reducing hydrogenase subunit HndA